MNLLLLVSKDPSLREALEGALPGAFRFAEAHSPQAVIQALQASAPDLLVADLNLVGAEGIPFLDAVRKRRDPPFPMVLVAPTVSDPAVKRRAQALKFPAFLERPLDEEALRAALAPYAPRTGPPPMTLLECLGAGFTDPAPREVSLEGEYGAVSFLFGRGYLWSLRHPLFPERYRKSLAESGFQVPPEGGDPWLALAEVEERLGPSRELHAVKQSVILSTLGGFPPHGTGEVRITEAVIPEGLLPVDIPPLLVTLADHLPESALSELDNPRLRVRVGDSTIPEDLPIRPQHGYLLSECAQPRCPRELRQAGILPPREILSGVYLLCLLGLMSTDPAVEPPFRLGALKAALDEEENAVRRQSEAIQALLRALQIPGQSPYQILGVPPGALPQEVERAADSLLERLNPDRLHPEVQRRHQRDLLLINAKINEARLLLQSALLQTRREEQAGDDRLAVQKAADGAKSDESRKAEARRMVEMARELLEQDQAFEASQYLKVALFQDPDHAPSHHLMAEVYLKNPSQKAKHMAEKELLRAAELDPKNLDYLLDVAEFYMNHGLLNRCRAFLDKAQAIELRNPRALAIRKAIKNR
jgi:CheY-like chemotaxis protein